jgi:antitoxin (DNA-binding transcriptional repressor) of toxin-antitoxin stability system
MDTPSVGIREFRASLAEYSDTDAPVTITCHGQAVGLFVPLRRPSAEDLQRLAAAAKVREAMPLNADEVEEVVADFDAMRRRLPLPSRDRMCDACVRSGRRRGEIFPRTHACTHQPPGARTPASTRLSGDLEVLHRKVVQRSART